MKTFLSVPAYALNPRDSLVLEDSGETKSVKFIEHMDRGRRVMIRFLDGSARLTASETSYSVSRETR
jgi:hypothetical protein